MRGKESFAFQFQCNISYDVQMGTCSWLALKGWSSADSLTGRWHGWELYRGISNNCYFEILPIVTLRAAMEPQLKEWLRPVRHL